MLRLTSACLFVLFAAHSFCFAESWPQFLGPRRDGVCRESGLNLDWNAKPPKTLWKVALGPAYSSVSVVGDRVLTMTQREQRDVVVCLDAATGKEVWAFDAAPAYVDFQKQGAGPRSTPTFHDGKLYCLLPRGELFCLSAADGKEVWKVNMLDATGAPDRTGENLYWGHSASPLVEGDLVIVPPGGTKNNALAAFHKDSGKLVWAAGDDSLGYSSPVAVKLAGRRQVVAAAGKAVLGLDPEKGTVLWRYAFGNNRFDCTCATPLVSGNLVFVSAAYGVGCALLEIVPDGDKLTVREKWKNKDLQNLFPTSILLDGHLYGCNGDLGACTLRCVDLETGKVRWQEREPGRCSLVAADGRLICLSENGTVRVVEANPEKYVVRGEPKDLLTLKSWAAPVIADGRLYLRDDKHLICLDLRGE